MQALGCLFLVLLSGFSLLLFVLGLVVISGIETSTNPLFTLLRGLVLFVGGGGVFYIVAWLNRELERRRGP